MPNRAPAAEALEIAFEFGPENKGPKGPSPEISVKGIPAGTVELKVALKDLNSPKFKHGGGTVAVEPGLAETIVSSGALKSRYKGPYPPRSQVHRYTFTVTAIGADGSVLAKVVQIAWCDTLKLGSILNNGSWRASGNFNSGGGCQDVHPGRGPFGVVNL